MAIPDDASDIASTLHRAFMEFEPLYTPEAFATTVSSAEQIRLRMSEGPIWVALQDDMVVGTVSVARKGDALYIRSMAVDPAARGSGIGRELMRLVEEYAAERGFERLYLSTTPFLGGAIRLYERCGFVRNDEGPDHLFGTPLFTMEKNQGRKKEMSDIQTIIDDLKNIHDGDAWHGPSLKEILSGVTAEQAAAKQLANAHSIWELTTHIAGWEDVVMRRLAGQQLNEPEEGDFPPVIDASEEAWRRTLTRFDQTHRSLIEAIAGLTTERLRETVPGKDYTVEYMLRGEIRHHVYHAGQIALLKKGFGTVPRA